MCATLNRDAVGGLQFDLFESPEGDGRLYLYERFKDKESFDLHLAADYTKAVFKAFENWLAEDVKLMSALK